MIYYSINQQINALANDQEKEYLTLYVNEGYEIGFGRSGKYQGHSHLFFYDILFSLDGITTSDHKGNMIKSNIIIVPPRTYLGDVITGDFFFFKFCPTKDKVPIPDKVEKELTDNTIKVLTNEWSGEFCWYPSENSKEKTIYFDYKINSLHIEIEKEVEFIVAK